MTTALFEQELDYFKKNEARFKKIAYGKYVLLKGNKDYGFFDTDEAAYDAGVLRFGHNDPFCIHWIIDENTIADYPAYEIGFINANL